MRYERIMRIIASMLVSTCVDVEKNIEVEGVLTMLDCDMEGAA
jgi:hypothetical protein